MLKTLSFLKDNWPQMSGMLLAFGALLGMIGALLKKIGVGPDSRLFHAGELLCSIGLDIGKVMDALKGMIGPKAAIALALLGASLFASHEARALDFKVGPSCSLMEMRLGTEHPVQLAPGLGVQGGLDLGNWSVDAAFFGALFGLGPAQAGALSLAFFGCYAPLGACLGPLIDLTSSDGGGIAGKFTWKQNFGLVLSVNWDALSKLHFGTAAKT